MRETLLKFIENERERKMQQKIIPAHTTALQAALFLGVSRSKILQTAKELEVAERIRIGRTATDNYFEITYSS